MRMVFGLVICATLTACATPRADRAVMDPIGTDTSGIVPVTLRDLRGADDVLIFPDVPVPATIDAMNAFVARCFPEARRVDERSGLSLYRGLGLSPFLTARVATVSRSSALGVGGSGLTDDVKEALAATVRGRPRCAA